MGNKIKIALHSVPRSGSTWVGNILNSHPAVLYKHQPLYSYAFKDFLNASSTSEEIELFFSKLEDSDDDYVNQRDALMKNVAPRFEKEESFTHLCYKEVRYHHILENMLAQDPTVKIIGLLRNPLSVISSWLKAPKEFKTELGWKIEEEWRAAPKKNDNKPEEFNGYEKWKEVTALFLSLEEKYPDRFYLLNYDDLIADCAGEIKKVFEFCELNYTAQTQKFIDKSSNIHEEDAYSIYKNKEDDNQWQSKLPEFIINEILEDKDFKKFNAIFNWV